MPLPLAPERSRNLIAEDLEAARALVDSTDQAELFLYPGAEHLFADSSLAEFDASAAALLAERVLAFLAGDQRVFVPAPEMK